MAVTRAKATALLNKTEMGLYDDSRANALRGLSEARLNQLVTRARTARDRARDLEKRQRLASRGKTGSKSGRSGQANARTGEKAELLADILKRLETQHRDVSKANKAAAKNGASKAAAAKKASAQKAPAKKKVPAKKAATKQAVAKAPKQVATKKTAPKRAAKAPAAPGGGTTAATPKSAKVAATKPAAKKPSTGKSAAPTGQTAPRPAKATDAARKKRAPRKAKISPEQALDNTRKLLEQHDAEAKAPKPWETLGADGVAPATPGYQSPQARANALALHAAESRQASIQGSVSTRDRRNQGKRDHRNEE